MTGRNLHDQVCDSAFGRCLQVRANGVDTHSESIAGLKNGAGKHAPAESRLFIGASPEGFVDLVNMETMLRRSYGGALTARRRKPRVSFVPRLFDGFEKC
jgi:hypothetical protein